MGHHKVLSPSFSHDARIASVQREVFTNGFPQVTEDASRSCEMESCKVAMLEDHISRHRTVACHHVDDPVRQSRLLENFHDHLRTVDLGVRWLPNHNVAHQCSHCWQVAGDGREIERRDGKHKPFERPVFQTVPNAVSAFRLLCMNFLGIISVESQEIRKFTCRINFSLKTVFSLRQHGCSIDFCPVGTSDEVSGFQEYCCAMFPAQA